MSKKKRRAKKTRQKPVAVQLKGTRFLAKAMEEMRANLTTEIKKTLEDEIKRNKARSTDYLWTTGAGQHIPVSQMDDDHLRNTICFLQRRIYYSFGTAVWLADVLQRLEALVAVLKEAQRRGIRV